MSKIYTFQFQYDGIDDFGSIQFCAKNQQEAEELFQRWCIECHMKDEKPPETFGFNSVEVVHDDNDKDLYGDRYGEPEEYEAERLRETFRASNEKGWAERRSLLGALPRIGSEVTEVCPNCDSEVTMTWDVGTLGYKAHCPVCGGRLMLCDMCHHRGKDGAFVDDCDYDSETDTCRFNRGDGGWISVDDALPEEVGSYLIYRKPTSAYGPYICKVAFWGGKSFTLGRNVAQETVKYWRPLPKPPANKKGASE